VGAPPRAAFLRIIGGKAPKHMLLLCTPRAKERTFIMPRRQPTRSTRSVTPLPQTVETPPPTDDPTYQALLKAENEAYLAWLQYRPDGKRDDKQSLNALRGVYEERLNDRKAYQHKAEINHLA
jgi:hypothetical protein